MFDCKLYVGRVKDMYYIFSYLKITDMKIFINGKIDKLLFRSVWESFKRPRTCDLTVILIAFH